MIVQTGGVMLDIHEETDVEYADRITAEMNMVWVKNAEFLTRMTPQEAWAWLLEHSLEGQK